MLNSVTNPLLISSKSNSLTNITTKKSRISDGKFWLLNTTEWRLIADRIKKFTTKNFSVTNPSLIMAGNFRYKIATKFVDENQNLSVF